MAAMQSEAEHKEAALKEELLELQQQCSQLKSDLQGRDGQIVAKNQVEDDLETARADFQAAKLANDEYRRTLRAKNQELAQFKRETDSLAKMQSLKIKELELVANQNQKRLNTLQTENESLVRQLTDEKT